MEFGALQCVPSSPDCGNCPLQSICIAFENNSVSMLPVKSQKKKPTNRYFNYLFIRCGENTYLQKRIDKDVWQNLFEFPLIESEQLLSIAKLTDHDYFKSLFSDIDEVNIHKISNRVIFAQFFSINVSFETESMKQFVRVPLTAIDRYAVSRLMELFFEKEEF
jgi:A/G-specific adenine glycosylase